MNHGAIATYDNDRLRWADTDADQPLPFCRIGESLSVPSYPTFDSGYGLIPGTVIDTQESGAQSVAYQIAVEAHDVTIKIVGAVSLDTIRWYGALETADETGTLRGGDFTATLHDDDVAMFIVAPGALQTYRYFGVMHEAGDSPNIGFTAVKGFSK